MGRVLLAVVGPDGEDHAVLAGDPGEACAEVEADTVLGVQVGEDLAELRTDDRVQRGLVRFDDGDLGPVAARGRCDLQADPARSRDHQMAVVPAERGQDVPQPVGVGEPAQMVHARETRAGDVQAARLGAGRQQQLVVVDGRVVTEAYDLDGTVDGDNGLAQVELDVGLCVPGGLVDVDAVTLVLARQETLGQGRAFVGVVAFVTDEDHTAREPFGAEGFGGLRPREPAADDDERQMCVDHLLPPWSAGATCERPARSVMGEEV